MDVHLAADLAAHQGGHLGRWQLVARGVSGPTIDRWQERGVLHPVHDGVFAVGHRRDDLAARHWAAVLTAPGTVLSHASAAEAWGIRRREGTFETVTRPGDGGPRRIGDVLVFRSVMLDGHVMTPAGEPPRTSPGRTLLDLAPHLGFHQLRRAAREALRLRLLTGDDLLDVCEQHRGRRGTAKLRRLAVVFAPLRLDRTRSDAEAFALEVLAAAGVPQPEVNRSLAGRLPDLVWHDRRLVVELDGPGFHLDVLDDVDRDARWTGRGYVVRRLSTQELYGRPWSLVELVQEPTPADGRTSPAADVRRASAGEALRTFDPPRRRLRS